MAPIRKVISCGAAFAALLAGTTPVSAGPITPGYAAILVDANTREVLYANGADLPRHPASITKIMTLFLAFDALAAGKLHLDDQIVMSRHAASQRPSKLGLAPGRSISVEDALRVIAVKSANDVAVALGEKLGGTEEDFAAMMTRKARSIGMRNTNFVNATGLPDAAHVTTARDLAIMSSAIIRTYPRYYSYFSTQKYQYEKLVFANHNHLLGRLPGMDGIKTGYTVDAGFTLAASAVRDGRRMIAVVLGEPTAAARDRDVTALIDTGFAVEQGRAQGQAVSVASLLAPLAHPAIRIALPMIEQGSGDGPAKASRDDGDDEEAAPARPAAPIRLAPHVRPADVHSTTRTLSKHQTPARSDTKNRTEARTKASAKPTHPTKAEPKSGGKAGKSHHETADAPRSKHEKPAKKPIHDADAHSTKKHKHDG